MKVGAHPLVVAVALGFLNPAALASEVAEDERDAPEACPEPMASPCPGCTCEAAPIDPEADLDVSMIEDAWLSMAQEG